MNTRSRLIAVCLATSAALLSASILAAPADIRLPAESVALHPSDLPGYAIASRKCGICHSADYVAYQPPHLTLAQWTGEMTKMQKAYGAPISDDEIKLLAIYLAATYGDAKTVSDADRARQPAVVETAASTTTVSPASPTGKPAADVTALLAANGCLACHAIDRTVVGPAYHDVAAKYRTEPQAQAHVAASIVQGGAGKWGAVPMPPFPNLDADQAGALAAYVLGR